MLLFSVSKYLTSQELKLLKYGRKALKLGMLFGYVLGQKTKITTAN